LPNCTNPNCYTIGIDFDNTIVSYDSLLFTIAREQNLINVPANPGKQAIRDMIRLLPDGEIRWQELQADVYGPRIAGAILIDGVWAFIKRCQRQACQVYIISHKTEYSNLGKRGVNLREAALGWMEANGFFDQNQLGLDKAQVLFGASRQEKITHIRKLGCTHFIDDLEEVFLEPNFPTTTEKILFAPQSAANEPSLSPGIKVFSTWQQITDYYTRAGILSAQE